ncbi:MAG: hypothetical protein P1V36_17815, partial [Planctomycetota bacterium]|nr:hypothetical protein [Planctomycetota bacterium]
TVPGRADCTRCHTSPAGYILGFRSEQLDRVHDYGGARENQLEAFARIGCFEGEPRTRPAWPGFDTPDADPTGQVRAYLAANCAFCHMPKGTGNARIDLRYETPLARTNLRGEPPGQGDLGVRGALLVKPGQPSKSLLYLRMLRLDAKGMPNLAHNAVDKQATAAVKRWIAGMR